MNFLKQIIVTTAKLKYVPYVEGWGSGVWVWWPVSGDNSISVSALSSSPHYSSILTTRDGYFPPSTPTQSATHPHTQNTDQNTNKPRVERCPHLHLHRTEEKLFSYLFSRPELNIYFGESLAARPAAAAQCDTDLMISGEILIRLMLWLGLVVGCVFWRGEISNCVNFVHHQSWVSLAPHTRIITGTTEHH